jgi:hypothetical protein
MRHGTGYYHLLVYMILYFFFNGLLLPEGLLYTTVLSPVMLYFLYKNRDLSPSPAWILLLLVPVPFHWLHGVDPRTYLVSSTLVISVFIFFFTAMVIGRKYPLAIPELFKTVLVINGFMVGMALLTLPFPMVRDGLWYTIPLSAGIESLPRLKLFTYEPSYYALIMMPVFLYFLFRLMFGKEKHPLLIACASIVPLLLSLSFGVIGAALTALFITLAVYYRRLPVLFRRICIYTGIFTAVVVIVLLITWSGNPVFLRIENIMEGKDTSAMGRLVYSFMFAKELAFQNNGLFGVGPGQIKILAHDLIVNHFKYHGEMAETVRIPNVMAEMLATYGVYGFALKLLLEIYFFLKRRIYANVFAFTLFVFLFVYQFTGSFLVNVAELAAWALVFSVRFPEFEIPPKQPEKEVIK